MFHIINFAKSYKSSRHLKVLQFSWYFLIWSIAFALFEFFMPIYLEQLNLSFLVIGIILSGSSFVSFFADPILGYIQEKFSPKFLLLISILIFILNVFIFLSSGKIIFLLFLAANLYGIAFDLFNITSYKNIFDNSIESDRSANISFLESFNAFGLLFGAILAGFVITYDLKYPAYLAIAFLALLFFIIFLNKNRLKNKTSKKTKREFSFFQGYKNIYLQIKNSGKKGFFLIFLLTYIFLFDGFFFVFQPIFGQKFTGYFINEFVITGFLLALYVLPIIFFSFPFGKLADKLGRNNFIIIGLLLSCAFLFLLQKTDSLAITAISIFLISTGFFAIALPALVGLYESYTEKRFGVKENGCSASIMELTLSLGFLLGPFLGGLLLNINETFELAFKFFSISTLIIIILSVYFLKIDKKSLLKFFNLKKVHHPNN